ncbi:MAG: MBL fold metallo-hydrolase [archaeon YNP-LCB-003-016]|uniref:MBL fold metallo-hydrolase n=1 Tax=Candidatus Culexarchaeum yellowstonense TaxID=2928963 RepID=UPI0026E9EA16|nr:MBL fold metallo-hydrolase [Candidatus Culexarchaeum yellowstonense]MCR6691232.1 MBL fold metallo-hydrolase [Candidatus Culexarchaeum yellowstonense]
MGIKVTPIAFESLGVRSMCTYIETRNIRILIDPGASLGFRYGKMPHPLEYRSLMETRRRMYEVAEKVDTIIITHYHTDHYTPLKMTDYLWTWTTPNEAEKLYEGKKVIIKDYKNNINLNQRRRGWILWKLLSKVECKVEIADDKVIIEGDTKIIISKPVPHGEENSKLGYVVMVEVEEADERVLFASDVQGPQTKSLTDWIISLNPNLVILSGPPTYMPNALKNVNETINNIAKIKMEIKHTILDHHILRDKKWREYFNEVREKAKNDNIIETAAEYLGVEMNALECIRDELYEREEPPAEFTKWCRSIRRHRGKEPPPI